MACARTVLMLLGLAVLSGCGSVSPPFGWFSSSTPPPGPPGVSCPTAAVLRPLAQTATFAQGFPRQPMGVAFYGVLSEVSVVCSGAGDALLAALDVVVIGERGPAVGKADGVDMQYFVAVTGPGQTVLSKRSFAVHIAVPVDTKRAGVTDHIEESIPLAGRAPGDLNIVVGFQQSPDVVDFYKHFRGR